ncbi:MAG: hypothetical protein U1E27_07005 [Kiritimatiellia bacterium]|nr:hypothetical protein [Kiritimatiellia bacterium]
MSPDWFSRSLTCVMNRRRVAIPILILILLFSLFRLIQAPIEHSLSLMLPKGSESRRLMDGLAEMEFSGKVAVSLARREGEISDEEFLRQADDFARSLPSAKITKVLHRLDQGRMFGDLQFFMEQAPGLLEPGDLTRVESRMTPEGVETILRAKYRQLLRPEGSFLVPWIRRDPLDLQSLLLQRIQHLSSSFGYRIQLRDGHLFSEDGNHLLMILETPVSFTDSVGSRLLLEEIESRRKAHLSPEIRMELICGHLHSLGNEKTIRRDIGLTAGIAGVGFLLLFLVAFRDLRVFLIFILPFAAVLVAIALTSFFIRPLSPMVLGFSAVLAGITVDYGIHVYIAIRRHGDPVRAVRSIALPLLIGALTTAAVFAAFLFTRIEGYHQLAVLALSSVFIALTLALLILPALLSFSGKPPPEQDRIPAQGSGRRLLGLFALGVLVAIPLAARIRFNGDIARLNAPGQEVTEAHERFREIWGGGELDQAILTVSGPDLESAMVRSEDFYRTASDRIGAELLSSFSSVWKSAAGQEAHAQRWSEFWTAERKGSLRILLTEAGRPYGFADDAFDPFFAFLETPFHPADPPAGNQLFEQLQSRFVQRRPGGFQVYTFFPDTEENLAALRPIAAKIPGAFLLSRRELSRSLTEDYVQDMARVVGVALALMLLIPLILLRSLRMALIALTPALSGVLGMLAALGALRVELNIVNLMAAIVVTGLCIDYGVFYTYAFAHRLSAGTREAVALSAVTTLLGAGSLLWARHPALFSVGLSLFSGVGTGYLSTLLVVPACCRLFLREKS